MRFRFIPVVMMICVQPLCSPGLAEAQNAFNSSVVDIQYREESGLDAYAKEKCRLDIHRPEGASNAPVIVWFHGGGLTKGEKFIPKALINQGVIIVAAGYRLNPQVKSPTYIEDAAAAVAWTIQNISNYGGAADKVFVSGHSAGGYLASMIGLDPLWLAKHQLNPNQLAGLIPFSGHTITHFTIRAERGIPDTRPVVDEFAPLFHVRKDAPPVLLVTGDRDKELLGRYEENAYLWRMFKEVKHPDVELLELQGYDHGGMAEPAFPLLLKFVRERSKAAK